MNSRKRGSKAPANTARGSEETTHAGTVLLAGLEALAPETVSDWLCAAGFRVRGVAPSEALTAIAEAQADVVLLEIDLPNGERLDTLARLTRTYPRIPVVAVIPGANEVEAQVSSERRGVFDLVEPPFERLHVLATVHEAVSRRRIFGASAYETAAKPAAEPPPPVASQGGGAGARGRDLRNVRDLAAAGQTAARDGRRVAAGGGSATVLEFKPRRARR